MIEEPKQADIDKAFEGSNFGTPGETAEGRRNLVADCVLKRACGFCDGGTIEAICKELGLLTPSGTAKNKAKHWAYFHVAANTGTKPPCADENSQSKTGTDPQGRLE